MPPILPSGTYTFSPVTENGTYYIGPRTDNPDAICILPGNVDPQPIFTLINLDGANLYNFSIDGRSVGVNRAGQLVLEPPDAGVSRQWQIDPGAGGYWSVFFIDRRDKPILTVCRIMNVPGGSCWWASQISWNPFML
ncbi:hypothetical protein HD554DRAFT_2039034 [Boletus coccyginus]|nr:hypothetical protein HD554DRAFT_2039034 [Boletus coccyginus]